MASTINGTSTGSGGLISTGDGSGILNIQTNETTAVTIDASQRAAFVAGTAALPSITTSGDTNTGVFFPAADTIAFSEGGAEAMRIDSSGNLLVGKTTDATTSLGWSLASGRGNAKFSAGNYFVFNRDDNDILINFRRSDTSVGTITVTTTATAYNTSSDYRLKHDIAPMTGALAKVALLKPVTYKWNVDNSDGQGFIAHELQELCPGAVTGKKDDVETYTDEDGNEQTRIKPQGIDTSFLVATLTAAIQEQQVLITAQAETINALTARIVALDETLTEIKDRFPK